MMFLSTIVESPRLFRPKKKRDVRRTLPTWRSSGMPGTEAPTEENMTTLKIPVQQMTRDFRQPAGGRSEVLQGGARFLRQARRFEP